MRLPIALLALFCLPALADESVPEPAAMMPAPPRNRPACRWRR